MSLQKKPLGGNQEELVQTSQTSIVDRETKHKIFNRLNFNVLSNYDDVDVEWLIKPYIAQKGLTILAGSPGMGKTSIICKIAACITTGTEFFEGEDAPSKGKVLIWSSEDPYPEVIKPRAMAAGADLSLIATLDDNDFNPAKEIDAFIANVKANYIDNNPEHKLKAIIIDPLHEFISGDKNSAERVSESLKKLILFSVMEEIPIIGIHHFSKNGKGNDISLTDRVTGSLQFSAKARAVLGVAQDKNGDLYFGIIKSNFERLNKCIKYKIVSKTIRVAETDRILSTSEVVFEKTYEYCSLQDMVDGKPQLKKSEIKHKQAAEKLYDYIAKQGGSCLVSEVEKNLIPSIFNNKHALRMAKQASEEIITQKICDKWYCVIKPNMEDEE